MVKTAKNEHQLREERREKLEEEALKCKQKVKALQKRGFAKLHHIRYHCYKEALEEYGLTLEMTRQRVKTYTLSGNYRKIMERAHDMSWKIMRYNNPVDTLIRSDLEELKGAKEPEDVKDGKYKALIMEFNLPSSSYATMVLREILKMDTSSSSHALMNDYHQSNATKKIIISDHEENPSENADGSDSTQASSLLSDSEKYEEFKNTIFQTIEGTTKRKNEEEVEEDGSGKKIKTEDVEDKEQTGIKMEASVV
ncbi:hypothetical protein NQ317_012947 [Molorchus minor]|uniref:Pseudouridylate synthase n=1 Tax=Molorchus minor TaxID=1323400 RepID=A0ABQ9JNI2_9CUCU|nr:hypothetical protein NQ317_012947 [Molorchus minor]